MKLYNNNLTSSTSEALQWCGSCAFLVKALKRKQNQKKKSFIHTMEYCFKWWLFLSPRWMEKNLADTFLAKVTEWPICVQMPHRNLKGLHLSKTFMIYMHSHKPVPGCCHFLFPYSSVESWDVKLSEPYNDCWLLWCCLQLWWLFSDFQLPNGKNILNLEC